MPNSLYLTDLIDIDTLQSIQDVFSDMTGLAAVTSNEKGAPITVPSGFSDFCIKYTRTSSLGQKRCEMCDKMGAEITYNSGKPCSYFCHAGLVDFAAPIMANGKMVGSFIGGQVLTSPPDFDKTKAIAVELGIDPEKYVEAIKKVNVVKKEQIDKAANFLFRLAENLSKMAYNAYLIHESNIKIEKANKMKSDFLANMSHEIRTPMNAVLGMADLALREQMSPMARDYIHQIKTSGKNLLVIINDILDFSKIESGKMDIIEVEYELLSMINDLASIINNRIGNKNIEFIMDISPNLPQKLWGDNVRIHQIILNLLTNAVKFTKDGEVKLSINCKAQLQDELLLTVSISDTGIGIKKEDLTKIFNSFQQVDSKRNRNIEGTGLGLAISQQLLNLMGGNITVSSEYGRGSVFKFELPQKIINPAPCAAKPEKDISAAFMINNPYVKKQLMKDLSWICARCVDMSLSSDSIEDIDVDFYIIEKNLFVGNVEKFIKNNPDKQCLLIDKFNGMHDCALPNVRVLRKPVYSNNLYNAMGMVCMTVNQESTESQSFSFIAPDAHILIVDDNHVNLVVAKGLLEPLQMNVDTAICATEAVDMVKDTVYDVIFMDHMMPEIDGVEATHMIRAIPGYTSVPIIALSANAVGEASEMFIREGMNDFVAKPIEVKDIVAKLRKWLPNDKITPVSKTKGPDGDSAEKHELEIEGLNVKSAIELLGSESLFMDVLREYYLVIDKKANSIAEHRSARDWKNYTIEVHALKSTSKQVGADHVSALAAELERAGKEMNIDFIEQNTDELIEEFLKYKDILKSVFPDEYNTGDELKSAEPEAVLEMLTEVQNAIDEFDTLLIDEVIEKMKKFEYPNEQADNFSELISASEISDFEQCAAIIEKWKKML